ncbi:hypothetical protein [Dongia sp.]|uniref:hypothetical protein n=1 Tax=Dongia sp. TaxID=1977262 RepID=UPI0035AF81B8
MRRPANNNGEEVGAGSSCNLGAPNSPKRRFLAAAMMIHTADEMFADGNVGGALQAYQQAIGICPPCRARADFRLLFASHLFDAGFVIPAVAEAEGALLEDCSYHNEAHRYRSFALAAQGRYGEARQALAAAADAGEDAAFAAQYALVLALADAGLGPTLALAETSRDLAESSAEYRCRLALMRAELHRLDGNRAALAACLDLALAEDGEPGPELALWLGMLDRYLGRTTPRDAVLAAFAAAPEEWPSLAWLYLQEAADGTDLAAALGQLSITRRAENRAIVDRFQGLMQEMQGNRQEAAAAYRRVCTEPHVRWCADWHIAMQDLARLEISVS